MNTKLLIGSIAVVLLVLFFVVRQTHRGDTAPSGAQLSQPDVRSDRTPDGDSAGNDNTVPRVSQTAPPPPTETEQLVSVPAPLLLEPEYGSPTYLDLRDEATRKAAGYRMGRVDRTTIARVNWDAVKLALQAVQNGERRLNPPLELALFDGLSCKLSSVASVQEIRSGHFMLHFSGCDGNADSGVIMLSLDPDHQAFSGTADIQGLSFDLGSLPQGHVVAFQVSPSSAPAELN